VKKSGFIILFLVVAMQLLAQEPYFKLIGKPEGLPSNVVYDVFQDKQGFIWMAHSEGLSRYDGHGFVNYQSKESVSPAGSTIQQDVKGRIWYSSFDGYLYYVENDTIKQLNCGRPLGYTRYGLDSNYLYTLTDIGVLVIELNHLRLVKVIKADPKRFTLSIQLGKYYVVQEFDRYHLIEDSRPVGLVKRKDIPAYLPGFLITGKSDFGAIFGERDNRHGYFLDYNFEKRKVKQIPFLKKDFFQNYCKAGPWYWACSQNGVYGVNEKGELFTNAGEPLFKEFNVSSVFLDRNGNYWFATLSDGVILVNNLQTRFHKLGPEKTLRMQEFKGGVLIGTRSGSLIWDNLKQPYKHLLPSVQHEVISLFPDTLSDRIFISSRYFKGIDLKGKEFFYRAFSLKDFCLLEKGIYAYAASGSAGLIKMPDASPESPWLNWFKEHTLNDDSRVCGFPFHSIRARAVAYVPSRNRLYLGSNFGVYEIDTLSLKELLYKGKPFFSKRIISAGNHLFFLDGSGQLFRQTEEKGFEQVLDLKGIQDIRFQNGKILLHTSERIYTCKPENPQSTLQLVEYLSRNTEINDLLEYEGRLLVATNKGVVLMQASSGVAEFEKPPFVISKVKVGKYNLTPGVWQSFDWNNRSLSVDYSIINYNPSGERNLYYRINEGDWLPCPQGSRNLYLPALAAGDYRISFRFQNLPPEKEEILFFIHSPFYQRWWFILVIVIGVAGLVAIYYRIRLKAQLAKSAMEMEKMELEKSLGQSTLTAIRSQMNPHFFYNALNTVQSLIYKNDKRLASNYLVKFSRLTRMILEMSEKDYVNLGDEVQALKLYLELEKGRFSEDDFDYSIELCPELQDELLQIPSMLIQPFAENAIKHGLLHKTGHKELRIHFNKHDNFLLVEVEDNGIGREESARIKRELKERWNSFSGGANQRRLEILNKGKKEKIVLEYTDLLTSDGKARGTLVKLTIPITYYHEPKL